MRRIAVWTLLLFIARFSLAQTVMVSGVVRGVVSDHSGAVLRDAEAVLISADTAQRLERTTNSSGIFVFPAASVGRYTLEVTAHGFQKSIVQGVDVQVGQTTPVEIKLVPGAGSESITVTGESPLLRSEDSSLSSVINRSLLDGVPLSGRRF